MFAMKIAFARLLLKLASAMYAAKDLLDVAASETYLKQGAIRREAERKARLARRSETELAREALARLEETQEADERAITKAAWKN